MKRAPVTTLDDLDSLDEHEVLEGYWAGKDGWPEPGDNHSRAYWHGWRNGRVDGGHARPDAAQMTLVRLVLKRGWVGDLPFSAARK